MSDNISSFGATDAVVPPVTDAALATLVGEGRKFASVEDLAKGKIQSDSHIESLEDENKTLRDEIATRKNAADLVAELRTQSNNGQQPPTPQGEQTSSQLSADDVAALVKQTLETTQTESYAASNLTTVEARLVQEFGETDKQAKVAAKAVELGVGIDFLLSIAKTSPTAFYETMGMNSRQIAPTPSMTTGGDVNNTHIKPQGAPPAEGTQAYYRGLRRTDRKKYYASDTQIKMITDRQRLGEGFYK